VNGPAEKKINTGKRSQKKKICLFFESYLFLDYTLCLKGIINLASFLSESVSNTTMCHFAHMKH